MPAAPTRVHGSAIIASEAEFTCEFYEDITTSNDGTIVPVYNNNRASTQTSPAGVYLNPTVTDTGTKIWSSKIGSGRTATVGAQFNYEMMLKPGIKYWFKIIKTGADTHYVDYDFWYHRNIPKG
jgi:hypothetical protein